MKENEELSKSVNEKRILTNAFLWWQFLKSTVHTIRKAKVNYCLGFTACFLVVFVVSILVTILSKAPLVFMRLSELDNGEMDTMIRSNDAYNSLNYSLIAREIISEEPYNHHTARIQFEPAVYFSGYCPELDPEEKEWKYRPKNGSDFCGYSLECFHMHCESPLFSPLVIVYKSEREKEILLGRDWTLPPLKQGEAYISAVLANSAGAKKGDYIYFSISLIDFFGPEVWKNLSAVQMVMDPFIFLPFKIADIYVDSLGKYGTQTPSVVMIEYDLFLPHLINSLYTATFSEAVISQIKSLNLDDFASQVIVNFPAPRVDYYLQSNYDIIQKNVIEFANSLFYKIGFSQVLTTMPVLNGLSNSRTKIIALFLGLILNMIIFILLFLSILLIYSLLMINVETRTFELGVMRMIGTSRKGLIMLLLVQAFSYAIPSWILGLISSELCTYGLADILSSFIGVGLEPHLSGTGILWASLLGLFVPIAASILPIRNALGKNLHDALDTRKSKVSAVKVKLERADPTQAISWTLVAVGAAIALFGATVYYVFPLALLSFNLGLLLNIFFFLLIGMLLGLTILSLNVQPILERIVLFIFFFWENKAIRSITGKNLIAHRVRNRKTTIMYALSLGFIIFITVAYSLQVQTFAYNQQQRSGCFLKVTAYAFNVDTLSLTNLNRYLHRFETLASEIAEIENYAWVSHPIENVQSDIINIELQNLGEIISQRGTIYTVSPSFYKSTLTQFLDVDEARVDKMQLSEYLYSEQGIGSLLVSSLYKDTLALNMDSNFVFGIDYGTANNKYRRSYRFKPLAFLDSSPAFVFSPFPAILRQDTITGYHTFQHIVNQNVKSVEDIPFKYFLIKLKDGLSNDQIDSIIVQFQNLFEGDGSMYVWDYRNTVKPFEVATVAITYFFNATTIIAMAISFFSLMSSMFTNVYEQTKEIAILRALGISKFSLYRIYIYEAFVLVMSSSLLGMLIGTTVSYTMTLQQLLFTQLPIPFSFPWTILITVFLCSILFSILAAFSPIYRVLQLRVVQIFRILT